MNVANISKQRWKIEKSKKKIPGIVSHSLALAPTNWNNDCASFRCSLDPVFWPVAEWQVFFCRYVTVPWSVYIESYARRLACQYICRLVEKYRRYYEKLIIFNSTQSRVDDPFYYVFSWNCRLQVFYLNIVKFVSCTGKSEIQIKQC